jgi:hypothetical protein
MVLLVVDISAHTCIIASLPSFYCRRSASGPRVTRVLQSCPTDHTPLACPGLNPVHYEGLMAMRAETMAGRRGCLEWIARWLR